MLPLPVDAALDEIVSKLRQFRAVVLTAQPGAGKTTRVPPALVEDGPVILLQPRRVAARSIAARIAGERGWTLGREVGWQIRFERRFAPDTRLLVVTEGILTARLQADPLLSDFRTIVFDEFHERSIQADVAMALAKQAWRARAGADPLRIAVMSATLETDAVSAFLHGCPVVSVPGRLHPLTIEYAPGVAVADAALGAFDATPGSVLCFLPGAQEIRRTIAELGPRLGSRGVEVIPLHGSLDSAQQDVAVRPAERRRVVVATNIAETSLTVPGVTAVVDSGLLKVARYDAERAIDSLEVERITADSAEQRAGRAGRLEPGRVWRLWDRRDRLRPHREPDIHRVDLSAPLLDVIAWGGRPRELEWFEQPREEAMDAAIALLERLELVEDGRLTALGERVRALPLHPRLGRMLVAARGAVEMVRAVAILSERHFLPPRRAATTSDLLAALDDWPAVPPHVDRVAREIARLAARPERGALSEADFRRAVLAGYPDRVARRRAPRAPSVKLASGAGATIGTESGVVDGDFLVALDVTTTGTAGPARIRLASVVEREWLHPNHTETVHHVDPVTGRVRATRVERYDELVLSETPGKPDPDIAAQLVADAWLERGPGPEDLWLLRRLRFAGHAVDLDELVRTAARGAGAIADVRLERGVPPHVLDDLAQDAPDHIVVPSGRSVRLEYAEDGTVSAAVKLQELFGLAETPRIGRRREPVLLALLSPSGRPVQLTRDLRSFWDSTYQEVRKELRGRYPRHPWPDDPWNARPSRRAKPKTKR